MNGIMATPNPSNFYTQDLISSTDQIATEHPATNTSTTTNNNTNNSTTTEHTINTTTDNSDNSNSGESRTNDTPQKSTLENQEDSQQHSLSQSHLQSQTQSQLSSSSDIPTAVHYSTFQQQAPTGISKNQLLDNLNYYQQSNYSLGSNSDYYQNNMGSVSNNEYHGGNLISPSFQMSSLSTPDAQGIHLRKHHYPQQTQNSYQQQQVQQQQQQQSSQSVDLFNQTAGLVGKQQGYKHGIEATTLDSQQQPISYSSNNTPTMLYSQSSMIPLSSYQFSFSPAVPSSMNQNQLYPNQRQQSQQQQQQQQLNLSQQKFNEAIRANANKIRSGVSNSATSLASVAATNGRQLRAAPISSSIPQTEYPDSVIRPKVATTRWDDENTNCYQVRAKNILVSRREDTNYINGTKLLNVIGMTRGKRDGILKTEKIKNVVKVGSMNLKGIWIPFDRAFEIARNEGVDGILYPLFVKNIKEHFLTKGHKMKSEDDFEENDRENDELLNSDDLIRTVEGGSDSTTNTSNSPLITQEKYREHQYLQQKDNEIYSSKNTPLNVSKPF